MVCLDELTLMCVLEAFAPFFVILQAKQQVRELDQVFLQAQELVLPVESPCCRRCTKQIWRGSAKRSSVVGLSRICKYQALDNSMEPTSGRLAACTVPDRLVLVGANCAEYDDVLFSSLVAVHGANFNSIQITWMKRNDILLLKLNFGVS